jgi:drug/metabolite transporter (DMT)-like permease
MESQRIPILLYLLAGVLGAFGQYFYKVGARNLSLVPILRNYHLFSGVAMFAIVMVLFVAGFKLGGRMSVVYPVYATTFLWGALIAFKMEGEPIHFLQLIGIAVIVVGVSLVAIGSGR